MSGFWGWALVVVIVAVIFSAGKLPQLKEEAELRLKEGKKLLDKSKKELENKAIQLAEKAKEVKEAKEKQAAVKKTEFSLDDSEEITADDLKFEIPETKPKKKAAAPVKEIKIEENSDDAAAIEEPTQK